MYKDERKIHNFIEDDDRKFDEFVLCSTSFSSLVDLYKYLKSEPQINPIFLETMASINNPESFAGAPLEKAIEYCISKYDSNFDKFLKLESALKETVLEVTDARKMERGIYGGVPLAPLVSSNVPDCMLRYERESDSFVRNIYLSLQK